MSNREPPKATVFKDPFEHVLVINLEDDRGIGRRKHMMQQFKKANILRLVLVKEIWHRLSWGMKDEHFMKSLV